MKRNPRNIYLFVISVVAILMAFGIFALSMQIEDSKLQTAADRLRMLLRSELEKEKSFLLSLTIALSQNSELANSMAREDEDRAYEILNSVANTLQSYTEIPKLYIQLITKDLNVFIRSWDYDYSGFFLGEFRADLLEAGNWSNPKVSIESGRILSFKSLFALKNSGELVGYLEVVHLFDQMVSLMREYKMQMIVLMDQKQLEVASLMQQNPVVSKYVIANKEYNHALVEKLAKYDLEKIIEAKQMAIGDDFLVIEPMFNGSGDQLGVFLIATSTKRAKEIFAQEKISFYLDFSQTEMEKIVETMEGDKSAYISTPKSAKPVEGRIK